MKNLKIKGINIEMTEAIEDYFRNRINSLDKYIDQDDESVECNARVSKTTGHRQSGEFFKAEVSIHTAGKIFGAVSEKDNLYAAIDDVRESVARKIISYKNKKRGFFRKGAYKIKNLLKGLRS